jgi:hypothetical protein
VDTSRQPRTTLLGPAAISKSDRLTRLELGMAMALDKTCELMVGWQSVLLKRLFISVKYFYTLGFGNATNFMDC